MEPTNETPEATPTEAAPAAPANPPAYATWNKRLVIGGVALAALAGIGIASAMSEGFGPGKFRHGFGHGRGFGGHIERVLDKVDATPEQTKKIEAIIDATEDQLDPMAEEFRDARREFVKLLEAPTIDRAAVETLRATRVAKIDEASRKVVAAVLDAAETLTPEQRAEIVDHFNDHARRW